MPTHTAPRIGARVLLLDTTDRVLLIHALDPDDPGHHRVEHVFLGRTPSTVPQVALRPSENEKAGLIERRWWSAAELRHCQDKLLPDNLAELLDALLAGRPGDTPLTLLS
ncbi:MAG: hypothetical protein ACT4NY_02720 [Pseudonocardiales bacterium]